MTVTSGLKCLRLLKVSSPVESSVWNSKISNLIWRVSDIKQNVSIFRLVALDYKRWNGTSGLLQRPLASDSKGAKKSRTCNSELKGNFREMIRDSVTDGIYPEPNFVEWIKGFPENWTEIKETDLKHSETP